MSPCQKMIRILKSYTCIKKKPCQFRHFFLYHHQFLGGNLFYKFICLPVFDLHYHLMVQFFMHEKTQIRLKIIHVFIQGLCKFFYLFCRRRLLLFLCGCQGLIQRLVLFGSEAGVSSSTGGGAIGFGSTSLGSTDFKAIFISLIFILPSLLIGNTDNFWRVCSSCRRSV